MIRRTEIGCVTMSRDTSTYAQDHIQQTIVLGDREGIIRIRLMLAEFAALITGRVLDNIDIEVHTRE